MNRNGFLRGVIKRASNEDEEDDTATSRTHASRIALSEVTESTTALADADDLVSGIGSNDSSVSLDTVSSSAIPTSDELPTSSLLAPTDTSVSAAQSTATAGSVSQGRSSSEKGLIAGIVVLAILFAVAMGAVLFLLFRKRRKPTISQPVPIKVPTALDSEPKKEYETSRAPSVSTLESSIAQLEKQLHAKDSELRNTKAQLLASGKRSTTVNLSNHQIHIRFARLIDAIGDWVARGFESFQPASSPPAEVITVLQRISISSYDTLLRDPSTQHLVLRGMVADIIAQAFVTDQFFGDVAFAELKHAMSVNASATDLNEWRALTIRLLSRTSSFQADRATTIEDITKKINYLLSSLTQRRRSKQRVAGLRDIVEWASNLALDLAIQKAMIKVERPGGSLGTFDPDTAVDVSSEGGKELDMETGATGESAKGKQVKLCVFPSIARHGDESGAGYEREHLVSKAHVLL